MDGPRVVVRRDVVGGSYGAPAGAGGSYAAAYARQLSKNSGGGASGTPGSPSLAEPPPLVRSASPKQLRAALPAALPPKGPGKRPSGGGVRFEPKAVSELSSLSSSMRSEQEPRTPRAAVAQAQFEHSDALPVTHTGNRTSTQELINSMKAMNRSGSSALSSRSSSVLACELVLVRHGETDWNAAGRLQGQLNPGLNAKGVTQSQALAAKLAADGAPFDAIYSSDLSRAMQTAQAVASLQVRSVLRLFALLAPFHFFTYFTWFTYCCPGVLDLGV